jgi:hypothetical protein
MSPNTNRSSNDILLPELMFTVLDYLLPHQSTGLALSCRRLLELTDNYFSDRLPSSKGTNRGVTLRWASKFRKLPPLEQSAIENTVGVLPLLDVLAPFGSDMVRLYLSVSFALNRMKDGTFTSAICCIENAARAASEAGVKLNLCALKRRCWEAQLDLAIKNVSRFAREGFDESALLWVEKAKVAASEAECPLPEFSGVFDRHTTLNRKWLWL